MNRLAKPIALASLAGALFFGSTSLMAQQGPGGRGGFDPAQFQQRMMERYQEMLGMSAEEFKAVQPLIENVMTKQREAGMGGFGGGFGGMRRGGQGGGPGAGGGRGFGTPSPEAEALQKAVDSGTPSEIKAKLAAYRDARKKNEAALQDAREKLRKVLTVKQEAALVLMRTLD